MDVEKMFIDQTKEILTRMKKRKTRRGKRKNQCCKRKIDSDDSVSCSDCMSIKTPEKSRRSKRALRPRYSPKAPQNSTQFIMDDHWKNSWLNSCDSEFMLDTGHVCSKFFSYFDNDENVSDHVDDLGVEKVSRAIDVDLNIHVNVTDTMCFMEQNFENEYRNARSQYLDKLSKSELCEAIIAMEEKAINLENKLEMAISDVAPATSGNQGLPFTNFVDVKKLIAENKRIRLENDALRQQICNK